MIRNIVPAFALVCSMLLFACGGDDDTAAVEPTAGPSTDATVPVSGLPSVKLQRVFPNLTFRRMTGMYQAPDGSWWVTEQEGRIVRIDSQGQASTVLDISDRVSTQGNEEGLLGLAFAPDFERTKAFFVYYSAADPRRSVISRFTANAAGTASAPASETVRLEIAQPFSNHNGGQIVFGADGFLYVGLGDGGSANDPQRNGQNLNTLLGKLLRIDMSGESAYKVPADNPFAGRQDMRGEIWAYGLRNPWRFSFDSATGDLWLADVGQGSREEVDIITKGGNYGWNIMEGTECRGGGTCNRDGLLPPVTDYSSTGEDCSITGGFVYRGTRIGGLRGAYVYGDYCTGKIWGLRTEGFVRSENQQIADADFSISSFAQGRDGEIYVLQHSASGGGIYQLAP
ncbi:MAG TPA: PQQ-dependent sugar dehydrogenase [Dehalococcoidia bacterium]